MCGVYLVVFVFVTILSPHTSDCVKQVTGQTTVLWIYSIYITLGMYIIHACMHSVRSPAALSNAIYYT